MIASNIKKLMNQRGVTLKQMAKETGLAEMTLIRARGNHILQCRLETLVVIAKYLGCKTRDLFSED